MPGDTRGKQESFRSSLLLPIDAAAPELQDTIEAGALRRLLLDNAFQLK